MSERYVLPSVEQLLALSQPHRRATTICAATSPKDREHSRLAVRSPVDEALRGLRESGNSHAAEQELRRRWAAYDDSTLWGSLSSPVLLLADDVDELFVLPNRFDDRLQVGSHFDLSQLVRAVTTPQEAFALTLSQQGRNLWHATATHRAEALPLTGDHPMDVAAATNRATGRRGGRDRAGRGDEAGAAVRVRQCAAARDVPVGRPHRAHLDPCAGRAGRVGGHDLDAVIRSGLAEVNARLVNSRLDKLGDAIASGTVARDLADIARGAALGA